MLLHRATKLYDRCQDEVSRDEVRRIAILSALLRLPVKMGLLRDPLRDRGALSPSEGDVTLGRE
jgi:hypothetical protein